MGKSKTSQRAVAVFLVFLSILSNSGLAKYSGGTGEPNDPYQIDSADDLLTLAADTNDYGKCFILTADIDMEGQVFTTAIIAADISSDDYFQGTAFTGTFDGNGHKITHFTIDGGSNWYLGLFGYVDSGGSVKNLGLENFAVSGSADEVGGLVGWNDGSISDCYSTGTVSVSDYFGEVGGLVGANDGSISNCCSTGAVSGSWFVGGLVGASYGGIISNCYSTGTVSGYSDVGGLVGFNYGSINNCYSTGAVSGSELVGGLVGENYGTISGCYFLTNSGLGNGYGTPLPDWEMRQQSSFVGWDFVGETANGTEDIWRMCINMVNYPLLWWQFNTGDFICPDGVDFRDFAIMANAWLSEPGQGNWNGRCEIAQPPDYVINILDLAIFCDNWLKNDCINCQSTCNYNGICDPWEDPQICPDCATCGNGICEPGEEGWCPDCGPFCGNGICEPGEEGWCPDCPMGCNFNGFCDPWEGPDCLDCQQRPFCGNGICEPGEEGLCPDCPMP
jgi:hypothetical protein